MKLTRRQRRFWFGLCFTVAAALILAMFWGATGTEGEWSGGQGAMTGDMSFKIGLLAYLEIDRTGVDLHGQPMSDASTSTTTINWSNLALNILATILVGLLLFYAFALLVKDTRLPRGLCDECGYDLRESTDQCPECGTRIAPATR